MLRPFWLLMALVSLIRTAHPFSPRLSVLVPRLSLRFSSSSSGGSSKVSSLLSAAASPSASPPPIEYAYSSIRSSQNPVVKHFTQLASSRKYRTEHGQTVVSGPKALVDALHQYGLDVVDVVGVESLLNSPPSSGGVLPVSQAATGKKGSGVYSMPDDVAEKLLPRMSDSVTPQGVVASVRLPSSLPSLLTSLPPSPFFLVLDGVQDPGNVGTLIRTALASSLSRRPASSSSSGDDAVVVVLLPGCADPFSPKVVRASAAAVFGQALVAVKSLEELRGPMGDEAFEGMLDNLYVASSSSESASESASNSVPHCSVPFKTCRGVLLGNEGRGLSEETAAYLKERGAKKELHVEMGGGVESLNAAVCGAVVLFERRRQLLTDRDGQKSNKSL